MLLLFVLAGSAGGFMFLLWAGYKILYKLGSKRKIKSAQKFKKEVEGYEK